MEPKPIDPYAISKVASEKVLANLCELNKIEYVIAVPHNIIGPRQRYDIHLEMWCQSCLIE